MTIRNISEELDNIITEFQHQLSFKVGKQITYKLATKLYAEIVSKNVYIKNVEYQKAKRKKDRKIIFKIEMEND